MSSTSRRAQARASLRREGLQADEPAVGSDPLGGQVAIVTGVGVGNIGAAVAVALANAGANLVLADRLEGTTEQCADDIRNLGREAITVVADLLRPQAAVDLVEATVSRWGRVDILVNLVGGMSEPGVPVWELSEKAWDFTLALNLKPMFLCTKGVLPVMMAARRGCIVNVASTDAGGSVEHIHYSTAKAGVIAFTRSCALQVAPFNINVNVVSPGATLTSGVIQAGILDPNQDWTLRNPLGRPNEPLDVAEAVRFLCSRGARNITGAHLTVAGGLNPMC